MGSFHKHHQLRWPEPCWYQGEQDMRPGGELALDIKLEDGAHSQITVTVDAMLEYQSIQQSAGVAGIPTAHHEWLLETAKEGTLAVQREPYPGVGVLFHDPAYVEWKALKI